MASIGIIPLEYLFTIALDVAMPQPVDFFLVHLWLNLISLVFPFGASVVNRRFQMFVSIFFSHFRFSR